MPKSGRRKPKHGPVRKALYDESPLVELVQQGLGALEAVDKQRIEEALRTQFADSIALDASVEAEY